MKLIKNLNSKVSLYLKKQNPISILFLELVIGLAVSSAMIVLLIKLRNEIFESELLAFDKNVSFFLYSLRTPFLTQIMIFFSFLGEQFTVLITAIGTIFLLFKRHKREAFLFLFTIMTGVMLNILLKEVIGRPRPIFDPLLLLTDYSFPSGHAMNSFVFYALLAHFTHHFSFSRKYTNRAVIIALAIVFFIGISRIYLGVHYPTDIIGGYIAGLGWLVCVLLIEKTFDFYKLFKESKN